MSLLRDRSTPIIYRMHSSERLIKRTNIGVGATTMNIEGILNFINL
jgi:hypothetical protein